MTVNEFFVICFLLSVLRTDTIRFRNYFPNAMPIKVVSTRLPEVKIIEPAVFADVRGYFLESYNAQDFDESVVGGVTFLQDNISESRRGVVRGLHYQLPPFAQAKLVRCISGAIFDVAVDVRRSSPTLGQWVGVELSAINKKSLWIPEGFAHGFAVLGESSTVLYKHTTLWHPECEASIRWDDPTLAIDWPLARLADVILSEKDADAPDWSHARLFD